MSDASNLDHLMYRIERLFKSLGQLEGAPPELCPPQVRKVKEVLLVHQDFRQGMSDSDIRDLLSRVVFNIAHVKDPLKKVLRERGGDPQTVERAIDDSEDLKIVVDLANRDKHGYPADRRPRSKSDPRLGEVGRSLRLQTGSAAGSSVVYTLDPRTGKPAIFTTKGGRAEVVFTGDVLDRNGERLGDIVEIATRAVHAWERLFSSLEFSVA